MTTPRYHPADCGTPEALYIRSALQCGQPMRAVPEYAPYCEASINVGYEHPALLYQELSGRWCWADWIDRGCNEYQRSLRWA